MGAVDGADFLAWQRGESRFPGSEFDLAAWKTNYGATLSLSTSSTRVPEPAASFGIMLAGGASLFRRRRSAGRWPPLEPSGDNRVRHLYLRQRISGP